MTTPEIDALTDQQAITVLGLVLDYRRQLPDPLRVQELDAQVAQAATTLDPQDATQLEALAGDEPTSPGQLARQTLTYLVSVQPDLAPIVQRATGMSTPGLGAPSKVEPISMGVGTLVVLALQTEVKLDRGADGKWTFQFHKKALTDTALGTLIAKLIATYTGGTGL
jgi:hypothetical protein